MTALRLDTELVAEVRGHTKNLTAAIEEGLRLWLKRERRRALAAASSTLNGSAAVGSRRL